MEVTSHIHHHTTVIKTR
ncbi:hypothetical protein D018_2744A, partial [Vibrio parahaemolyticus VP2007-007]